MLVVKINTVLFVCILFILGDALNNSSQSSLKIKIRFGGLFTMYSRSLNESCDEMSPIPISIENSEMVLYTIDRVNKNESILPGVELEFNVMADCWTDTIALNKSLDFITENKNCNPSNGESESMNLTKFWGLIGPETSAVAVPIAKLLGLFSFSQISCGATSSALSDKQRFPTFFRTVPSDNHQIEAIIQLLERNHWNYVSFIYEDDEYGNAAFDAFKEKIRNKDICTAQVIKIERNVNNEEIAEIVRKLTEEARAKVVIGFVFETRIRRLFYEIFKQNQTTTFQWIGSDIWANLIYRNCSTEFLQKNDTKILPPILDGTIFFQLHSSPQEDFEEYLHKRTIGAAKQNNIDFAKYIAFRRNCSLEGNITCLENYTLPQSTNISDSSLHSSSCPNTVLAYAYALDDALKTLCNETVCDEFEKLTRSSLSDYLRNVSFTDYNNRSFSFDKSQDGPVLYNILRYDSSTGCWNTIGEYNENGLNFTNEEAATGRGNISSTCSDDCGKRQYKVTDEKQTCCWRCVDCPSNSKVLDAYNESSSGTDDEACEFCGEFEKLVMRENHEETCEPLTAKFLSFDDPLSWPVVIASSLGFILTLFSGIVYVWYWSTPLIRASGRELSFLILIGVFFLFSVSFLFCVEPTTFICGARRFGIGFSFSLVFSGLLVKTIRISIVFNELGKRMVREYKLILRPTPQIVIALLFTSVEVFVLIGWLLNQPPEVSKNATTIGADISNQDRYLVIDCKGMKNFEFIVGLGYPILLILVCTFYAIKIRKVPAGFNEAKFIGFAVYTTLVIWLAQLSSYFVQITSEIELRDAIYCMCLSLNALVILLALFGPKVYIAILRPEKNNQSSVMATLRHSTTTLVSAVTTNKVFETEGAYLKNSPRSRAQSVQIHSNLYVDAKHCSCCVLRQKHANCNLTKYDTLPISKPSVAKDYFCQNSTHTSKIAKECKKNGNTKNLESQENSVNQNVVDQYSNSLSLNNNNDKIDEFESHPHAFENSGFENDLNLEKP